MTARLYPRLAAYVSARQEALHRIAVERRSRLEEIARYVEGRIGTGDTARLTFICTHNSRRSQMAAIWARLAAEVCEVPRVATFSGGTEATAFDPRAVEAMRRAGFEIEPAGGADTPVYRVRSGESAPALEVFSKTCETAPNPAGDFCAVMTCSTADTDCPIVDGASARISIPYDDPGDYDGTGEESAKYDERCAEIATEMLYLFSAIAG